MHSTSTSIAARRLPLSARVLLLSFFIPALAFAQDTGPIRAQSTEDGYSYTFFVDKLSGDGFGPNDSLIRTRTGALRQTLIRPRTNFVPELLKTVENL
jgi:hypothetical protein